MKKETMVEFMKRNYTRAKRRLIHTKRIVINKLKEETDKMKKHWHDKLRPKLYPYWNKLRNRKAQLKQDLAVVWLYLTIGAYKVAMKVLDKTALFMNTVSNLTNEMCYRAGTLANNIECKLYEITVE